MATKADLSTGSASAATEHAEEPQLAELVTQEAGLSTEIELKVIRNDIVHYKYTVKANQAQVPTQKVQIVLQSKQAAQYCLGIARLQRKDETELKKVRERYQIGTTWRFKAITIFNDKPAYIHTACRIAIDLRKSQAQALLQSTSFPQTPEPTVTIADVLKLKQMQYFDLMATVTKILEERTSRGGSMHIADVRLVDGSKDDDSNTTEYASLPLTLFFKDAAELGSFKEYVGKTPLLFMCLTGSIKDGGVSVATVKDQFWWQAAVGPKADVMAAEVARMGSEDTALKDVAALPTFTPANYGTAVDYTNPMATLTACHMVDPMCASPASLLGDATEHLYQLNHVYVPPPPKEASIKYKERLFARFDVWDATKKISVGFRSKAMLQLAGLEKEQEADYEQQLANDELRHPLLVSLRLLLKSKPENPSQESTATEHSQTQSDNRLSAVVVEVQPCTFTDIPDDSVDAIHGLKAGWTQSSERLCAVPLDKLKPSPFYNMVADGQPVEKALTLLRFTQRSNGKQHGKGFRIIAERTQDATAGVATELTKENCYGTVALCTVEKVQDFSAAKDATVMAVISKVVAPSKPLLHTADLYIEAMEPVKNDDIASSMGMMRKLQQISKVQSADPTTSSEIAWQQRKCRRLVRYPTVS